MSIGYGPMEWYGHSKPNALQLNKDTPKGEDLKSADYCEKCNAKPDTAEAQTICPMAEYVHISVLADEISKIMSMGNLKSGAKIAKKVQQTYARQIRRNAEISANRTARSFEDHLKPKPRWMPVWLYRKVMSVFLRF